MIGPRVDAPQSARDHLTVVVGEVGEAAEPRDVTCSEDAGPRFERRWVHLQPAALRLREPGARHASTLGRRPVATSNRSAETTAPDFKWTTTADVARRP